MWWISGICIYLFLVFCAIALCKATSGENGLPPTNTKTSMPEVKPPKEDKKYFIEIKKDGRRRIGQYKKEEGEDEI